MKAASQLGDVPTLEWLRSIGVECPPEAMMQAAFGGHVEAYEWLADQLSRQEGQHARGRRAIIDAFMGGCAFFAAYGGRIEWFDWVTKKGYMDSARSHGLRQAVETAASCGRLDLLKWLYQEKKDLNIPWGECMVCDMAGLAGHLDVVQWARGLGLRWTEITCIFAIKEHGDENHPKSNAPTASEDQKSGKGVPGHPEHSKRWLSGDRVALLDWALGNGVPRSGDTTEAAAAAGNVEVAELLVKHGMTFDESHCITAAREGHVRLLEWFGRMGLPCTKDSVRDAATQSGKRGVVEWIDAMVKVEESEAERREGKA